MLSTEFLSFSRNIYEEDEDKTLHMQSARFVDASYKYEQ